MNFKISKLSLLRQLSFKGIRKSAHESLRTSDLEVFCKDRVSQGIKEKAWG